MIYLDRKSDEMFDHEQIENLFKISQDLDF